MNIVSDGLKIAIMSYGFTDPGCWPKNAPVELYEQWYEAADLKWEKEITAGDIMEAAIKFPQKELFPDHIRLTEVRSDLLGAEEITAGVEVRISHSELLFDFFASYSGEFIKCGFNELVNNYYNEQRLTRGVFVTDKEVLGKLLDVMFFLQHKVGYCISEIVKELEFVRFLKETDFLEEYEKMNLSCTRSVNDPDFKADKQTVLPMLTGYDGVSAKYRTKYDKFYEIKTSRGNIEVGYNVEIRFKRCMKFIFWGKKDGKVIFFSPDERVYVRWYGSGKRLNVLEFQTKDELKGIFDFMIKWLNKLADYLAEKKESNNIVSL